MTSLHTHHRSAGIPTSFPLQTDALDVNGVPQSARARAARHRTPRRQAIRPRCATSTTRRATCVEIIANAARNDNGDYKIRIYTIGMGELVRLHARHACPETSESILKRIANDRDSPDFNAAQLEGKYFYAQTAADVAPAFQGIQNQILRLSK